MAKQKPIPPKHGQWKKGQSGNPSGRPADPPELKRLKNLTKAELVEIGNLVVKGDMKSLLQISKDPKATVIKTMLAAVAVKVIQKGDMHSLDVLLNRLVGKVKDEIEHTGSLNPPQVIVRMPGNGTEKK